jgi:hypothetical protein
MGMHRIARGGLGISARAAAAFDHFPPRTVQDVGEAVAAALVVPAHQPAAAVDDADVVGAEERRARIGQRQLSEPRDGLFAGGLDRAAGGRGMGGAAGDAGARQVGAAGAELHLADIEAEAFVRVMAKLADRGVRRVHLFLAAPNSVVFRLGRHLDRNWPAVQVYQREPGDAVRFLWSVGMPSCEAAEQQLCPAMTTAD